MTHPMLEYNNYLIFINTQKENKDRQCNNKKKTCTTKNKYIDGTKNGGTLII